MVAWVCNRLTMSSQKSVFLQIDNHDARTASPLLLFRLTAISNSINQPPGLVLGFKPPQCLNTRCSQKSLTTLQWGDQEPPDSPCLPGTNSEASQTRMGQRLLPHFRIAPLLLLWKVSEIQLIFMLPPSGVCPSYCPSFSAALLQKSSEPRQAMKGKKVPIFLLLIT